MISDKFIRQFHTFIERHQLLKPDEKVLLAISGGMDSVAMGWLFFQLGQPFGIAHCNFKLRGAASDGDEIFVKNLAKKWNVSSHSRSFDTLAHVRESGVSIQMAARELRYQYFNELQEEHHYSKLATAHHVDDAFETMLLNVTHGTGFQGLMGIVPGKEHLIRPMLAFTREEIRELAGEIGMEWREDASNEKDDYERNKVRHYILPVLKELNPSFSQTLKDTLERIWASGVLLDIAVDGWENKHLRTDGNEVEIQLIDLKPEEQVLLYECLKRRTGLNFKTFRQLLEATETGLSGKQFHTNSHVVNLDRGRLLIHQQNDLQPIAPVMVSNKDKEISLPSGTLFLRSMPVPAEVERNEKVALLDLDKLVFPLEIRSWQQGDVFVPLGMRGQKKLSDFMIDSKIPVNLKSRVLVLLSAGQIAWVVGRRIDDRFKIDDTTRNVYRLELC